MDKAKITERIGILEARKIELTTDTNDIVNKIEDVKVKVHDWTHKIQENSKEVERIEGKLEELRGLESIA